MLESLNISLISNALPAVATQAAWGTLAFHIDFPTLALV